MAGDSDDAAWAKESLWKLRQAYYELGKAGAVDAQFAFLDFWAHRLDVPRSTILMALKNAKEPAKGSSDEQQQQQEGERHAPCGEHSTLAKHDDHDDKRRWHEHQPICEWH